LGMRTASELPLLKALVCMFLSMIFTSNIVLYTPYILWQ
jgi:hypothetical protein